MTGSPTPPPYFRHAAANTLSDNQQVIVALRHGLLSPDCCNDAGITLLLCAVLNQNFSLAEYLLSQTAAHPFASSKFGLCAAGVILSTGPEHLREMVRNWTEPRTALPPGPGMPVLRGVCKAAILGQEAEVERLLREGSSPDERDAYGFTPLCLSILNGLPESAQILLKAGASSDAEQTLEFISIDRWVTQFPKLFNIPALIRNIERAAGQLPANRLKSASRYMPIQRNCIQAIVDVFDLADQNNARTLAKMLDLGVPPDLADSRGYTVWKKLSDQEEHESIRFLASRVLGKPLSPETLKIITVSDPNAAAEELPAAIDETESAKPQIGSTRTDARILDILRRDDAPQLLLLVAENFPLNKPLSDGRLLLEAALELKAGSCFLLLLLNGASPDLRTHTGLTVKEIVASDTKATLYRYFVDHFGNKKLIRHSNNLDVLLDAIQNWDTIPAARNAAGNPELLWKTNGRGKNPLTEAARLGNYRLLEIFLSIGANPWQITDELHRELRKQNAKAGILVERWKQRLTELSTHSSKGERLVWSERLPWITDEFPEHQRETPAAQNPDSPVGAEKDEASQPSEGGESLSERIVPEPEDLVLISEDELSSMEPDAENESGFNIAEAAPRIGGLAPDDKLTLGLDDDSDVGATPSPARPSAVAVPPSASSLSESLRGLGYSLGDAVADIIDNSIAAEASIVWISYSPSVGRDAWLSIRDNGFGMNEAELLQAMKLGSISPALKRSVKDLGRFGLGLKTASFSQCRRLTVCSRKNGEMHAYAWDLDELAKSDGWNLLRVNDPEKDFRFAELMDQDSGTVVLWEKIDRSFGSLESSEAEMRKNRLDALSRLEKHLR